MSKQYKIKWRESDLQELTRVVNNFNAKLRRIEKKNPENAKYLPKFSKTVYDEEMNENIIVFTDRLTVNQMKELIQTRKDFNREINALKRFSRRGAEEIVEVPDTDNNIKTTKWQRTEINRRLVTINKIREERRKEIEDTELTRNGEGLGYTLKELGMGKAYKHELDPLKPSFPSMAQGDVKWKFRTILNESQSEYFNNRDESLRINYIKSLTDNFNPEDIKDIVQEIENLPIKQFMARFYAQGGNFETSYPPDEEQYEGYLNELKGVWKNNSVTITPKGNSQTTQRAKDIMKKLK